MNRPRNRQPRQGGSNRGNHHRNQPRSSNTNVPNSQQVIPDASVSIVLKADQPTGREVQGKVQDLLSRGDHPRGIKVRLQDGRIGRVQRMVTGDVPTAAPTSQPVPAATSLRDPKTRNGRRRRDDDGGDESYPQGPPRRTLGDYIPSLGEDTSSPVTSSEQSVSFSSATVKCPFCDSFEGDEAAVAHHIEEHLE